MGIVKNAWNIPAFVFTSTCSLANILFPFGVFDFYLSITLRISAYHKVVKIVIQSIPYENHFRIVVCAIYTSLFFLLHCCFPLQIRPQTTVQWYILPDYSSVRIGFNVINKHHTLYIVYTMFMINKHHTLPIVYTIRVSTGLDFLDFLDIVMICKIWSWSLDILLIFYKISGSLDFLYKLCDFSIYKFL